MVKYCMDKKNNKLAVYCRYSSAGQNKQSIDGQLATCYEWAERNGYMTS